MIELTAFLFHLTEPYLLLVGKFNSSAKISCFLRMKAAIWSESYHSFLKQLTFGLDLIHARLLFCFSTWILNFTGFIQCTCQALPSICLSRKYRRRAFLAAAMLSGHHTTIHSNKERILTESHEIETQWTRKK